jgi:anti-sigma-K factor RskA
VNVQDYIESGSIESCVLGLASAEEQRELDRLCREYPDIQAARLAFEEGLETAAMQGAIAPPPAARNRFLDSIRQEMPTPSPAPEIQAHEPAVVKSINWKRYLVAASLVLLAGSSFLNLYLYRQYRNSRQEYANLLAAQTEMANANKTLQTRYNSLEEDLKMVKDPMVMQVKLADMNKTNSMSTVYWDTRTRNVYLMVNHLPQPEAGKQYQLWAIVEGKPVDAGMVDMEKANSLLVMKNIPKAEAFAITLEKAGGSPVPTLTAMYVLGKV